MKPGNLFDQVDLAYQVGAVRWNAAVDFLVRHLRFQFQGREDLDHPFGRYVDPEALAAPLRSEGNNRPFLVGLHAGMKHARSQRTTGHFQDQFRGASACPLDARRVHAPFKAEARIA